MGEVIQFIPRTEHLVRDLSEPTSIAILPTVRAERFSDDVQVQPEAKLIPFSTDEYNEPPCA